MCHHCGSFVQTLATTMWPMADTIQGIVAEGIRMVSDERFGHGKRA